MAVVALVATAVAPPAAARIPRWTPEDHPRLLATDAEREAIVEKLEAEGTVSGAVWEAFRRQNRSSFTTRVAYADGAVLYWIDGDVAAGRGAIENALDLVDTYTTGDLAGIVGQGRDLAHWPYDWWRYRDLVLTVDFARDLVTEEEWHVLREFLVLQGGKCNAQTPSYSPGNIHAMMGFCLYATAVLLEGEEDIALTVEDEPVVRGAEPNTADPLRHWSDVTVVRISDTPGGENAYRSGADGDWVWRWIPGCGGTRCIDWSPEEEGSREPAPGTTYYVTYRVEPNLDAWKSAGRSFFEYHLDYQWRDGSYNGGISPYGNFMAEMLPYFVEVFRRDAGIDFSRNQDIKRLVDMYLYERIPGSPRRYNWLNDVGGWPIEAYRDVVAYPDALLLRAWVRSFAAWATTVYEDDPEGYDDRYLWLWIENFRNSDGTISFTPEPDWREAFWFNDTLHGRLPGDDPPPPTWPRHRYFRGKEIVHTHTGSWEADDAESTTVSFSAGPHAYLNEHDHGDSGSFTFFSLGEDWAIDTGYGYVELRDHNVVDIDGSGYPRTFGGFSHFDDVVLTDDASAIDADLTGVWSLTEMPGVLRHHRYAVVVHGGEPSYLVVADDVEKDGAPHGYDWYLHTGLRNRVSIEGGTATITGARTGATMAVRTLHPSGTTTTPGTAPGGSIGNHPLVKTTAQGTANPLFLHVLVPTPAGMEPPSVEGFELDGGTHARVSWPDGTTDTILWRHSPVAGEIAADGVRTDGRLVVVREDGAEVAGVAMVAGRTVLHDEDALVEVLDGSAPATVVAFGPTAGVRARDASRIRIALPFVTAATLEDGSIPIRAWSDGEAAAVNGGLPLGEMRTGAGVRFAEDFEDGYADYFFRPNMQRHPVEDFRVVDGAFELRETLLDWISISRRDSTPWRRAHVFPNHVPALEHDDAVVSFRYRFTDPEAVTRKLRAYVRTRDRAAADWETNQDWVRLELNAVENGLPRNEVALTQRVDGDWAYVTDNDVPTDLVATSAHPVGDTEWHEVSLRMQGARVGVTIDGVAVLDAILPEGGPAAGYLQWRVVGDSPLLLDDVLVTAIDETQPVAPTSGLLCIDEEGQARVEVRYGEGASTDGETLVVWASDGAIEPDTDRDSLEEIATATGSPPEALSLGAADAERTHAVSVRDPSGNESHLVVLEVGPCPTEDEDPEDPEDDVADEGTGGCGCVSTGALPSPTRIALFMVLLRWARRRRP